MEEMLTTGLKVAIVHEWFMSYAGSERVVEQMLNVFPNADLYALIENLPQGNRQFIKNKQVRTSFIQKLPFARKKYRAYLPLMPFAIEQFDLSGYDIIISSSHAVAKGVLTGPDQLHLCMCYSPIRYAWDLQHQYLKESNMDRGLIGLVTRYILHRIRLWDNRTANGVESFIAISEFIKRRIWKVYRRKSIVIYPPVNTKKFTMQKKKEDFYLTASRMVPYKRIDLIVSAFASMPQKKLIVIGDGPEMARIKKLITPNVQLLGFQRFEVLRDYMQKAKAFIFAAEEDFGIVPIEAQACGTPVIAYGKGGALETILGLDADTPTGVFFFEQNIESLQKAIFKFEAFSSSIQAEDCRVNALRFSEERFVKEFKYFVESEWKNFIQRPTPPSISE